MRKIAPVDLLEEVENVLPKLEGWCTPEKARAIATFIYEHDCKTCVEIGVYGGKSLIPASLACRYKGNGIVHGIDPWDVAASLKHEKNQAHIEWWGKLDHETIYRGFVFAVLNMDLTRWCNWHRMESERAANIFSEIDFLHIDGNHAEESALLDVDMWAPKVVSGGVIFFDDIDWTSTNKAYTKLKDSCSVIRESATWAALLKS